MKIDILTLFPAMFDGPFGESMLKRAQDKNLVELRIHDLRDWTSDTHKTVDDRPYGGGPGMVMMVEPIDKALTELRTDESFVIVTSASGKQYAQQDAQRLSTKQHVILVAGHYEGIDQRVLEHLADACFCIGPYVLTGGELPTMVMVDSMVRLLPGVLGEAASLEEESHTTEGYLEYPQYTRPESYRGWTVPPVLLSGNHVLIETWRKDQSQKRTTD